MITAAVFKHKLQYLDEISHKMYFNHCPYVSLFIFNLYIRFVFWLIL